MSGGPPIDGESVAGSGPVSGATLLLYDWFKHMTTLSLVTLGGLLSILQAGEVNVRPGVLEGIVVAIASAGILGFDGQARILKAELAGEPLPALLVWYRRAALWGYGLGTGMFLALFVESVK